MSRAADIIGKALHDSWSGRRYRHAHDVVQALAADGWYLVRVEHTVTEEPDDASYPFAPARVERIGVDVEGDGIYDVTFKATQMALECAHKPQELLAWQRRGSIIELALNIAKRKGWFDESAG